MSNWKPHADYSHPNWTGRTPNQYSGKLHTEKEESSVLTQVVLGALAVMILTTIMTSMVVMFLMQGG